MSHSPRLLRCQLAVQLQTNSLVWLSKLLILIRKKKFTITLEEKNHARNRKSLFADSGIFDLTENATGVHQNRLEDYDKTAIWKVLVNEWMQASIKGLLLWLHLARLNQFTVEEDSSSAYLCQYQGQNFKRKLTSFLYPGILFQVKFCSGWNDKMYDSGLPAFRYILLSSNKLSAVDFIFI